MLFWKNFAGFGLAALLSLGACYDDSSSALPPADGGTKSDAASADAGSWSFSDIQLFQKTCTPIFRDLTPAQTTVKAAFNTEISRFMLSWNPTCAFDEVILKGFNATLGGDAFKEIGSLYAYDALYAHGANMGMTPWGKGWEHTIESPDRLFPTIKFAPITGTPPLSLTPGTEIVIAFRVYTFGQEEKLLSFNLTDYLAVPSAGYPNTDVPLFADPSVPSTPVFTGQQATIKP